MTRRSFHFSTDQSLILLALASGVALLAHYPLSASTARLAPHAWQNLGTNALLDLLVCYCIARFQRALHTLSAVCVVTFSATIALGVFQSLIVWIASFYWSWTATYWTATFLAFTVWGLVAAARALRVVYRAGWIRVGLLSAALLASGLIAIWLSPPDYWDVSPQRVSDAAARDAPHVNTEHTYYAQIHLLEAKLADLSRSRAGVGELYFIGFAGTSGEDVFMKEIRSAQMVLDERFDTRGRSLLLVNNPHTVEELPVASATNLYWTLKGFAKRMNLEDDILLLYLTSHGSPHVFSISFPELALDSLSDQRLKSVLDRAGVKWRIVVISACYSGSFIDALKDDHSLIITAAAEDKTSFGCSSENDFTYFGDAYINTALRQDHSFVSAFYAARDAIAAREQAENLTPSEPQIFLGEAMKAKLAELERRLAKPAITAATARD